MKRINGQALRDAIQFKVSSGELFIINRDGVFYLYTNSGKCIGNEADLPSAWNTLKALEKAGH